MKKQYTSPLCEVVVLTPVSLLASSPGNSYGDDEGYIGTGGGSYDAGLGE